MSSCIKCGDSYMYVANRRLVSLTELVVEIGQKHAQSTEEREFVERLRHWCEREAWPGVDFDLDERFPTVAEKKFWARCFFDSANWIFWQDAREEGSRWQTSTIGDAYIIARLLTRAVQEIELAWHPAGGFTKEDAEAFGRLRIQF